MANRRLRGKTILITGAGAGIGRATAVEFARACPESLKLIIVARRLHSLEELAREIEREIGDGVKVLPRVLDVSDRSATSSFVDSLPDEFKSIDVLVNNAGLARGRDQAPDIREEDLNLMMDTNVIGLINMTQAILPVMLSRGNNGEGKGDIINIGSVAGRTPYAGGSIYCATKMAVTTFTDALRRELIAKRIRVIEIAPGQVETEFTLHRFYGDRAKAAAFYAGQESLTPQDIAEIVVFAATRRENVVFADSVVYPSHQAAAAVLHKQ